MHLILRYPVHLPEHLFQLTISSDCQKLSLFAQNQMKKSKRTVIIARNVLNQTWHTVMLFDNV